MRRNPTITNQTNQTNNQNRNPKHSLLSLMTKEERKLTGKVAKSEIERTECGGETTIVERERGWRVAVCCEKGDLEMIKSRG
jgi:hypothetical protein